MADSNSFDPERLRAPAIGLGVLLVIIVMMADPLGLSTPGLSAGQVLVSGIGALLIAVGGMGRRVVRVYQVAALMILNTLVLLLLIEIGAGLVSKFISLDSSDEAADDARISQPYYADQEWSAAYWNEFNTAAKFDYAPYVVWRRPPFSGQTINVDAENHRVTPDADCRAEAFTLYAFGGSTMWGTGAPDWGTIPAFLQEKLAGQMDEPVCVVNFGQSAYVASQSMVELVLQLKAGHVPDAVIFYDGVNDTFAAYQSGRADAHQNLSTLQNVFSGISEEPFAEILADRLQENTYTVGLLNRLFDESDEAVITYETMGIDADDLAAQIVENYLENVAFVDGLARAYDFEVGFFWQPVIFDGDKVLTEHELGLYDRNDPALVGLFDATYDELRHSLNDYPNLYDLSSALDEQDATVYSDFMHITPPANAVIAEAMLAALELSN